MKISQRLFVIRLEDIPAISIELCFYDILALLYHFIFRGNVPIILLTYPRYIPKRHSDSRVMPGWYTWNSQHQMRSPFGLSAKEYQKTQEASYYRSRSEGGNIFFVFISLFNLYLFQIETE